MTLGSNARAARWAVCIAMLVAGCGGAAVSTGAPSPESATESDDAGTAGEPRSGAPRRVTAPEGVVPALADLELQADTVPNALDPLALPLDRFAMVRAGSAAGLGRSGRGQTFLYGEPVEYPVLEASADGPVRILDHQYGVALAIWVDRAALVPQLDGPVALYPDAETLAAGTAAHVLVSPTGEIALDPTGDPVPVADDRYLWPVPLDFEGVVALADLAEVYTRGRFLVAPAHAVWVASELRAAPSDDAPVVARFEHGWVTRLGTQGAWTEVLAGDLDRLPWVVAHGFVASNEVYAIDDFAAFDPEDAPDGPEPPEPLPADSDPIEVPAGTLLYDAPGGARVGRVTETRAFARLGERDGVVHIAFESDWDTVELYVDPSEPLADALPPIPQVDVALAPALEALRFVPDVPRPNRLDPDGAVPATTRHATLRVDSEVRVHREGQPGVRNLGLWPSDHLVIEETPDDGPIRVLVDARDEPVVVAAWVDRDQLVPQPRGALPVVGDHWIPPGEVPVAHVLTSRDRHVSIDAGDRRARTPWLGITIGSQVELSGRAPRRGLVDVWDRGSLTGLYPSHQLVVDDELYVQPETGSTTTAALRSGTAVYLIASDGSWSEVIAFQRREDLLVTAAYGFVWTDSLTLFAAPARAVGGGGSASGRVADAGAVRTFAADTPLFDAPDGALAGRVLDEVAFEIVGQAAGWDQIAVETEWWGPVELWVAAE